MAEKNQPESLGPAEEEKPASDADERERVREELEEALREKEQFRAMAQRAQADLINFRRRAAEEQHDVRREAKSQLLLKTLSIVDDLDRALALVPEDAVAAGWFDGLLLIKRNLENLLESEGVTKIEAEGEAFEPQSHEAVLYAEIPDGQEGKVVKVIREGYKLHDRVLRAAQVAVSKLPEPDDKTEHSDQEA